MVGRTTPRITSQRVAPSASAPSLSSTGTDTNRSRDSDATIGMIITPRISEAVNTDTPVGWAGPNSPVGPKIVCSGPSTCWLTNGAKMMIAQKPSTTLGTAASISTIGATIARTGLGAHCRDSPIPIARGAATVNPRIGDAGPEQQHRGAEMAGVGRPGGVPQE